MSEPDWAPLTGFRVAVTSARRAEELSALLERRGATVTSAAAITMVPLPDDDELRAHTEALIDVPPDIVIATTGIGFRGWVAAADGWGLTHELLVALGKARVGPDETGHATPLDKIEQAGGMTFVGWGIVTAQQNASRIGACQRLRELSFELCRRLRWKLQIEPAPRLDFSHDHGLPAPPSR